MQRGGAMPDDKPARKPTPGTTTPTQFRIGDDTKADLDLIAEDRTAETGIPHTRTDAVRYATRREADRIRKKRSEKK